MNPPTEWTHKKAVRRMAEYLRNTSVSEMHCSVVAADLHTSNHETPDVIGFSGSRSIIIECKVSRADFCADKLKSFRKCEDSGMGDKRYFAAPKGLITVDDLPDGWGLLEIDERCVRFTKEATHKHANKSAEVKVLTSIIRRLEISTAVFVRQDTQDTAA